MASTACLLLCLFSSLLSTTWAEGAKNDSSILPRAPCPPGVLYYNRFCYQFLQDDTSWDDAELDCQFWGEDGHLASILTSAEERMISTYIRRYSTDDVIWIGLQAERKATKLAWRWSDYSPYISGSVLWDNRTPSTALSSLECIALINIQHPTATSRWSQYSCNSRYPYLCKFRASS